MLSRTRAARRTMVPEIVPDRGSQRISLRASQIMELKRDSLFEGFTYEPTQSMAAGASRLRTDSEDLLDGLDQSDDER